MALSIGFRTGSFLPALLFKLRGLDFYPGGTFTHCSCQPSLDAHFSLQILIESGCTGGRSHSCWGNRRCILSLPQAIHSEDVAVRVLLMGISTVLASLAVSGCGSSFHGALNEGPGGGPVPEPGEPVVTGVSPASVVAGGPSFTITVTGTNFAPGDAVESGSSPLDSTFVSSTQMTAVVPNQMIYEPGSTTIVVQPPVPYTLSFGVGFTVTAPPLPGTAGFTLSTVNIQANDMAWDPGKQQIYLSVAGADPAHPNTITALDPVTGQFGVSVSAGPGADRLGVSSDGSWLYAGIDKNGSVKRFTLPGLASDITIPLGSGTASQPYFAVDLETAPGSPNTIAVSPATSLSPGGSVVIYDGST